MQVVKAFMSVTINHSFFCLSCVLVGVDKLQSVKILLCERGEELQWPDKQNYH